MSLRSAGQRSTLKKGHDLNELLIWVCDMATWYWSLGTIIWMSNIKDIGCNPRLQDRLRIDWMATTLEDDDVVVIGHTHPRSMSLATLTMKTICMIFISMHAWCSACRFACKGDKWSSKNQEYKTRLTCKSTYYYHNIKTNYAKSKSTYECCAA